MPIQPPLDSRFVLERLVLLPLGILGLVLQQVLAVLDAVDAAQHADAAFVDDLGLAQAVRAVGRDALALDRGVGGQGHGRAALVADGVGDREHGVGIDRDGAGEHQALAVVIGQHDRRGRAQHLARRGRPHRLGRGQAGHAGDPGPAEVGEPGVLGAGGTEQLDRRRVLVGRLGEALEPQVVDPRALQGDRARQGRGVDIDPGALGLGGLARQLQRLGRAVGAEGHARLRGDLGLGDLLGAKLGLALLLLRTQHQELVADQDRKRADEEHQRVFVGVVLHGLDLTRNGGIGRGGGVRYGRRARARAIEVGGEAYQRGFDIVKQTPPVPLASSAAGDEHIVATGAAMKGEKQPGGLAQASFGAISLDRAADLLGGGESDPDQRVVVVARGASA
jgi:hypothetical protein